jgi:hypothetical protein
MQQYATARTERGFKRNPLPLSSGNSFVRAVTARAIARISYETPREVAARMWPSDRVTNEFLARAASTPAMTTVTGWAAELAHRVVHDALEALGPAAAATEIFRRGLVLSFDGAAQISAPGFVASAANAGFVAEGDPIPVRQFADTAALLQAYKLASIAVLSREMIESSNAEALIGDVLSRAAGAALDVALLDANPATAARPAGLRNGISLTTASVNTDPFAAVAEDLAALINVTAPVGGNGPYVLVASPGRAVGMAMRFISEAANVTVVGSSALTNDIIVIAPGALVAAFELQPDIETSKAASLHMDTAPIAVGPAAASSHRSLFQTDSLALKVRWPVSWILRDPRGVAWTTPVWK